MTSSLSRRSPTDFEVAARRPWLARAQLAAQRRGPVVALALIVGAVAALGISSLSGVKYQSTRSSSLPARLARRTEPTASPRPTRLHP